MALEHLRPEHPAYKQLQRIELSANRATKLTNQLLSFASRQIVSPSILNLNDLILSMNDILRRLLGENIELVILLSPDLGTVRIDPTQMEQVILNLALNARDAMPEGGKIIIETSGLELNLDYTRQHEEVKMGKYVMIALSDTGQGIPPEVQKHIFEPFFTTKEKGKGTGLGLATSYGIVNQAGGQITVYSEPECGTTFKIYLPQAEGAPEKLTKPEQRPKVLPTGTETIMLAEDEFLIRELTGNILRKQGYTVLECANGGEALYLVENDPNLKIALLLTDIVMPQIGGKDLAEKIKKKIPGIKSLFMSGYTDGVMFQQGLLTPGTAFIAKPFTPDKLILKVREVLDMKNP
jgi:CheY-like chemotaxis protein